MARPTLLAITLLSSLACADTGPASATEGSGAESVTLASHQLAQSDPSPAYREEVQAALARGSAEEAADILARYCDEGVARACASLGLFVLEGMGRERDVEAGVALVREACAHDDPLGCSTLAGLELGGTVIPRDPVAGVAHARWACERGEDEGCGLLADALYHGIGEIAPDRDEATRLLALLCERRDAVACERLGEHLEGEDDRAAARAAFATSCERRQGPACTRAGLLENEPAAAYRYFDLACDGGDDEGCLLALRGHPGDDDVDLRRLAGITCASGRHEGCVTFARLLTTGRGGPREIELGLRLLAEACDVGEAEGCYLLGSAYSDGVMVPPDPTIVEAAFARACSLGDEGACDRP